MQRKQRRTRLLNYSEDSPIWIPAYAGMTLSLYEALNQPQVTPDLIRGP